MRIVAIETTTPAAAIIMTPVGHDFDAQIETPAPGFLESVRTLADEHGAVLIFDEVRTGFRLDIGGAQALAAMAGRNSTPRARNVSATTEAITTSRYHFRSAGTMYHGAASVVVRSMAASKATM